MENEEFYNYQAQFQMRQSEMEQKRCQLEKEMFSIMRSDKSLHSLQTNKLRSHWKAVCDRQKNARKRNEGILRDFEEFERNIQQIELKTKQLRNKKNIYEDKVKELYPQWREKVDLAFARNQLQSYNENVRVQQKSHVPKPALSYESTPQTKFKAEVVHQSTPVQIVKEEQPQYTTKAYDRRRSSPDNIESLEASAELPPPPSFAEKINIETKASTSEDVVTTTHDVMPVINRRQQLSMQDEISDGSESDSFNGSISMELKNSNNSHLVSVPVSKKISEHDGSSQDHTSPFQVKTNSATSPTKSKAPIVVPATKTSVQSFFSESESTSEVSPRNNAPLTSMSAYQAMLKNNGRGISAEDDSNDNLEDILSPRGEANRYEVESPDEDEHDLSEDASDISEVEEHNNYQPTMMASLQEKENMEDKKSKVPEGNRMPWDLDSDSDESLGPNSFHGNTTANSWKPQNTMEQDDFDFYD